MWEKSQNISVCDVIYEQPLKGNHLMILQDWSGGSRTGPLRMYHLREYSVRARGSDRRRDWKSLQGSKAKLRNRRKATGAKETMNCIRQFQKMFYKGERKRQGGANEFQSKNIFQQHRERRTKIALHKRKSTFLSQIL